MNYYNDNDPFAAEWLRKLIAQKLIPEGYVDDRSISEVDPQTLRGYTQCHFFAGIGGWPLALQVAGVPTTTPLWTGSCPCQPLSSAGKQLGEKDERHLWPEFYRLISECLPITIFGEQVASNDGLEWLDGVSLDLEELGYAVGSSDLPAACVGAPNIRQRAWWVANTSSSSGAQYVRKPGSGSRREEKKNNGAERRGNNGRVADPDGVHDDRTGSLSSNDRREQQGSEGLQGVETDGGMGNTEGKGLSERELRGISNEKDNGSSEGKRFIKTGFWSESKYIECSDGKTRRIPIEPIYEFTFDGISSSMGANWDFITSKLERWVMGYAKEARERPREILRKMWCVALPQAVQWDAGVDACLQEAEILLIAVCKLARNSQSMLKLSTQDISEMQQGALRTMWRNEIPSCASQKRGLGRSSTRELTNTLYCMPPGENTQHEESEVFCLQCEISKAWDVSKTLSALEKIWRSILDESEEKGNLKRFRADKDIIIAAGGFPLSMPIPGRVGLLKGAGNSINPYVGAKFIRAFYESREP